MNRFKKEEARAQLKAREGLSDAEIKRLDEQNALKERFSGIARTIHAEWFPEKYDHQLDSISDAADRERRDQPDECGLHGESERAPPKAWGFAARGERNADV